MPTQQNLHRRIWRWHFYAGLFCIPFIIVLSLSGAIYLFKPQIENLRERPYNNIQTASNIQTAPTRATPNEQIDAALQALPGARFLSYRLPRQADDAVRLSVLLDGDRYLIYINPFTLGAMAVVKFDDVFIEWVKNLHGELLTGKIGSILVELAASWAIVMMLTGLYLWWPRNQRGLAGILYPRIHLNGRKFWRDVHAVTGIWVAFFALFLLITALPWTSVWGASFKEARKLTTQLSSQDWNTSREKQRNSWRVEAALHYDLNTATIRAAGALGFAWPAELSVSDQAANEWKLASMHQNRPLRQTAWLDGNNGRVKKIQNFSDKTLTDRIIGYGIAAHEGHLFGWFNQVLGLFTAAALIALSISGFAMWRRRKPMASLGAPPATSSLTIPKWLYLPLILLPTLLASFLLIVFLEKAIVKNIPPLNRWFGLDTVGS